ncbi:hypothetical protein BH09VER1_BH09VER1_46550 [soil metagenome]
MLGAAADIARLDPIEKDLMRAAGLRWLRCGTFGFDFGPFLRGESQDGAFAAIKRKVTELRAEGFHLMGITPLPSALGSLAGAPGSNEYLNAYRRACAFLGGEYRGLIDWWQVANELDIWIFRDQLSLPQSVDFLKAGLLGLKEADASLKVGINITLFPSRPGEVDGNTDAHEGTFIAKAIYQDPSLELDYAGFDSYPGTWRKGGSESWHEYLDGFHQLTGKPIIIQEFGYSSAGAMMTPEEDASGAYPCHLKKWRFSWSGGHTPEIQAEFVSESLRIFADKPYVIGATYYRWRDFGKCWQCGDPGCPIETAWGLLDHDGQPKPAYHSLKAGAAQYFPVLNSTPLSTSS